MLLLLEKTCIIYRSTLDVPDKSSKFQETFAVLQIFVFFLIKKLEK
jgi:hypothetical protein